MSYAFEGVLCVACFEKAQYIISQISANLKLKVEKINHCLSSCSRVEDTKSWMFSPEMEYVASQISVILSQAILIRYDDRVGYRESIVFQEGYPIKNYDLASEIWVMIDEDGKPIVNGQKFTVEQIEDSDEKYEAICNAILLGIEFVGVNKNVWKEVHSFIAKPRWKNIEV